MKLLTLVVIAISAPAHAEEPDPDRGWQWEAELSARMGSLFLHGEDVGPACFYNALAVRHHRVAAVGVYDYCAVSWSPMSIANGAGGDSSGDGALHHVASLGRYYFASPSADRNDSFWMLGDFYAEAGVGEQIFIWDGGGELTRSDVEFGIGANQVIRAPTWKLGFTFGLHLQLSRRPPSEIGPATCSGPCDEATRPSSFDHGISFTMGVLFGG